VNVSLVIRHRLGDHLINRAKLAVRVRGIPRFEILEPVRCAFSVKACSPSDPRFFARRPSPNGESATEV
jgi:hypothetical protein